MSASLSTSFEQFYRGKSALKHLYPTEFMLRILLGRYPNLDLDKTKYPRSRILDLGFGDGRNFPLFHDLEMHIHGVEISEGMVEAARARFAHMHPVLAQGSNSAIPFDDAFFDYVAACHSCYYVQAGQTFGDNLREIARVLKPGGTFIFSLSAPDGFILQGAADKGGGHFEIRNDPYGLRSGTLMRAFADEKEIKDAFAPYFTDCRLGKCDDDYFGIRVSAWIGTATRSDAQPL